MKLITWNTQWCFGTDGVVSAERMVAKARAMADFDVLCDPALGALRVPTTHLSSTRVCSGKRNPGPCGICMFNPVRWPRQPPQPEPDDSPLRAKTHTTQALLCGDFNLSQEPRNTAPFQCLFGHQPLLLELG